MTESPDDGRAGARRRPPRRIRQSKHQKDHVEIVPKAAESRLAVIERLLLKPVDTVKAGQPQRMPALEAMIYQLLQKSLSGDRSADRALQKFEEFAHSNSAPQFEIVFVDNEYSKAFSSARKDDDV